MNESDTLATLLESVDKLAKACHRQIDRDLTGRGGGISRDIRAALGKYEKLRDAALDKVTEGAAGS